MAKNTPLVLPTDQTAWAAILSRWAAAINTRLQDIESTQAQLQTLLNTVISKNNLAK